MILHLHKTSTKWLSMFLAVILILGQLAFVTRANATEIGSISGVVFDKMTGSPEQPPLPLADVLVTAARLSMGPEDPLGDYSNEATTLSDGTGTYFFHDLPEGLYNFTFAKAEYATQYVAGLFYQSGAILQMPEIGIGNMAFEGVMGKATFYGDDIVEAQLKFDNGVNPPIIAEMHDSIFKKPLPSGSYQVQIAGLTETTPDWQGDVNIMVAPATLHLLNLQFTGEGEGGGGGGGPEDWHTITMGVFGEVFKLSDGPTPIDGAYIEIFLYDANWQLGANPFVTATTGEDGRFEQSLTPGTYVMYVNKSSMGGGQIFGEETFNFEISSNPDQSLARRDVKLSTPALRGQIMDAVSGGALQGATINISMKQPDGNYMPMPGMSRTTNDEGWYEIEAPMGIYIIDVNAPDYETRYTPNIDFDGTKHFSHDYKMIRFALNTAVLSGIVSDQSTGAPIEGAMVFVHLDEHGSFPFDDTMGNDAVSSGETNANGEYQIPVRGGLSYIVSAHKLEMYHSFTKWEGVMVPFSVGGSAVADIALEPFTDPGGGGGPGSFNVQGTIVDAQMNPVSNAWIDISGTIMMPMTGPNMGSHFSSYTNEQGQFTVALPPGSYMLDSVFKEMENNESGPDAMYFQIDLQFGVTAESMTNLNQIQAAALVPLSGTVKTGANLSPKPALILQKADSMRGNVFTGKTDGSGAFNVMVTPGNYLLSAIQTNLFAGKTVEANVTEPGINDLEIVMDAYPSIITGSVKNMANQGLLATVKLKTASGQYMNSTETDPSDGSYVLGSYAGNYLIEVLPEIVFNNPGFTGYVSQMQTLNITDEGNVQGPDFVLELGTVFVGMFKHGEMPAGHIFFDVFNETGIKISSGQSHDDGNFQVVVPVGATGLELRIPLFNNGFKNVPFPAEGDNFGIIDLNTGGGGCEDPNGCGGGCEDPNGCGGCEDPNGCGGCEDPNGCGGCEDPNGCGGNPGEQHGTIVDLNGNPIPWSSIQYVKLFEDGGHSMQIGEWANENGEFNLHLNDPGMYKVVEIQYYDNGFYKRTPTNIVFEFTATGDLMVDGTIVETLVVSLPEPNFTGTFVERGVPLASAWIEIEHLDEVNTWGFPERSFGQTNANGELQMTLKPGSYLIVSIGTTQHWFDVRNSFAPFMVTAAPTSQTFDVAGDTNITLKIYRDGQPIVTNGKAYGISFGKSDWSFNEWKNTNGQGEAYTNLEPGSYVIFGMSFENETGGWEWVNLNQNFDVTGDATTSDPMSVIINLNSSNVSGTLYDRDNNPVPDVRLRFIQKMEMIPMNVGGGPNETGDQGLMFEAQTRQDGSFDLFLPDGQYVIQGYNGYDPEVGYWRYVPIERSLNILNGDPVDGSGNPIAELEVRPSKPSLSGKLFQNDGTTPWANAELIFMPVDQLNSPNPWKFEKRARTDGDGNYELRLPSGTYRLKAISTDTRWIQINGTYSVEIANGAAVVETSVGFTVVTTANEPPSFNIIPPSPNVKGSLVTSMFPDGVPLTTGENGEVRHAWVSIQEKFDWNNAEPGDYPKFYGAEVQENGSFEVNIDEPGVYVLQNIGIETNNFEWKNIQINSEFTIVDQNTMINFGAIGTNVKGRAVVEGVGLANGSVLIRPVSAEANPAESWMHDVWAYTDGDGEFELYLPSGTEMDPIEYKVVFFSGPSVWLEVNDLFEKGTDAVDLGDITITSNVHGTITYGDGVPVGDAWVQIRSGSWETGDERWYGAKTDADGTFKLNINDPDTREYTIRGYYLPEGIFINTFHQFTLDGGMMEDSEGNAIADLVITQNVHAIVKESLGSAELLANAWITIKPIEDGPHEWRNAIQSYSGETGGFSLSLAPGDYKVTDLGSPTFWRQLNIEFSVDGSGTITVPAELADNLSSNVLIVAPPNPNLKGQAFTKSGEIASNGWVSIRPANDEVWDYSHVRWFTTDEDGMFESVLEDGDYVIASLSTYEMWIELNTPFTVNGSTLTGPSVLHDGVLEVRPPVNNVKGLVTNADGDIIKQGWLTIKNQSDGEHDWNNARWTETKEDGKFSLHLPQGEYIIVQAGGMVADTGSYTWIEPRLKFKVNADLSMSDMENNPLTLLDVAPQKPNVIGTLYKKQVGDLEENVKMVNGNVTFVRIDPLYNSKVLTRDGAPALTDPNDLGSQQITVADRTYIWSHTYWSNADDSGQFGLNLEPGSYYILFAGGSDTWYEPGTVLTVEAEHIGLNPLLVYVRPPSENFTGTISGLVQDELDRDWTQYLVKVVEDREGDFQMHWWVQVYDDEDGGTDGTGTFSLNLPLGSYIVEDVWTPFGQVDLEDVNINDKAFTIEIGSQINKTIDLAAGVASKYVSGNITLDGNLVEGTVTLKLVVTDTDEDNEDDGVVTKLLQTDDGGNFFLTVKAGYSYDIEQVIVDSFINVDTAPIDIDFEGLWLVDVDVTD